MADTLNLKKTWEVLLMDGKAPWFTGTALDVGRAGELIIWDYEEYKEDKTFYGPYIKQIIAPGTWKGVQITSHGECGNTCCMDAARA